MAIEDRYVAGANGVTFHVQLVGDQDATPYEYDCYDENDKQRWKDCHWLFVGLVVTVDGFDAPASVWAIEYGDLTEEVSIDFDNILANHLDDLKAEAIKFAQEQRDRLNAIPLG